MCVCVSVCVCVCVRACVYACLVTQSCLTLFDLMDCSLPSSFVHGILQARILEWVAISYSGGFSPPRDGTWVSCIAGRFFTTREAPIYIYIYSSLSLYIYMYFFLSFSLSLYIYSSFLLLIPYDLPSPLETTSTSVATVVINCRLGFSRESNL